MRCSLGWMLLFAACSAHEPADDRDTDHDTDDTDAFAASCTAPRTVELDVHNSRLRWFMQDLAVVWNDGEEDHACAGDYEAFLCTIDHDRVATITVSALGYEPWSLEVGCEAPDEVQEVLLEPEGTHFSPGRHYEYDESHPLDFCEDGYATVVATDIVWEGPYAIGDETVTIFIEPNDELPTPYVLTIGTDSLVDEWANEWVLTEEPADCP